MSHKITDRQADVLRCIQNFKKVFGYPPSSRDIQQKMGFASQTAAMNHLKALRSKGLIETKARKSRALKITDAGWTFLVGEAE